MMQTDGSRKVIIKIASDDQQENVKNSRKCLQTLQYTASDKENLAGRPSVIKDKINSEKGDVKRKKPLLMNKSVQTDKYAVTTEDLTSDQPSENYWQLLAEKREESLIESMKEIEKLKESVALLQEENKICKEMLEESKHLVEVLQEMLAENDEQEDEDTEENP